MTRLDVHSPARPLARQCTWCALAPSALLAAAVPPVLDTLNPTAGTRYLVRVQAVTPSYDVSWGWRSGTTANAQSLMLFMGNCDSFTLGRAIRLAP
jgi:hypothetical protein